MKNDKLPVANSKGAFIIGKGKPKYAFSGVPIANCYNTSIYFDANTLGINWSSARNIPTADLSQQQATFIIQAHIGRVIVSKLGYSAGFQIINNVGFIVCEVHFCEGIGNGYNNITYNVLSGTDESGFQQPKYFTIFNANLSLFWVTGHRNTYYSKGYSVETVGTTNYIQYSDCSDFPRTTSGFNKQLTNAKIINNQLYFDYPSCNHSYLLSNTAYCNSVFPINKFYRLSLNYIKKDGFFHIQTLDNSIYGYLGSFENLGYNTYYFYPKTTSIQITLHVEKSKNTIIDDLIIKSVSHPFGVKVPAHLKLTGKDALNNNLTNPVI